MESLIDLFLQEKEIDELVEELEAGNRPSTYRGIVRWSEVDPFQSTSAVERTAHSYRIPEFIASAAYI